MFSLVPLPYRILGAVLLVIALVSLGFWRGHHSASVAWEAKWASENARIAKEREEEKDRQAAASDRILTAAANTSEKHEGEIKALQETLGVYADANGKMEERVRGCRAATERDVDWLSRLAKAGAGTPPPQPPVRPFGLR